MDNNINDKTYQRIKSLVPIPSVDLIVRIDNKILLCRRVNEPAKGKWWLPGGRILKGEYIENAVRRKAGEELGIAINIEKQVGTYDNIFLDCHYVTTVFIVTPALADFWVKLDGQHDSFKFVSKVGTGYHPYLVQEVKDSHVLEEGSK